MNQDEILLNLCWYDSRNPDYIEPFDDDDLRQPRDNCFCDNCFYGRDKLALEILRLQSERGNNESDSTMG